MYLTDLHVERYGDVRNLTLGNLSSRITVFRGPNGCGKSTVVRFLRGLLFGLGHAESSSTGQAEPEGGWLQFRSVSPKLRRICRSRRADGTESFRLEDALDGQLTVAQERHLPEWVTEAVFREVFSAGYEEADRFELLTRLCLESGISTTAVDGEIRSAELALLQTIHERDGHGIHGGVIHRIAELRRRQQELTDQLGSLRRAPADVDDRIQQLVIELESIATTLEHIDVRLRELDQEHNLIETQLAELRRRNVLRLDRPAIENRIRTLSARLERWREIREAISRESVAINPDADPDMRPHDSLFSLRALVTRLENRIHELTTGEHSSGWSDADMRRDGSQLNLLQSELNALCRYLTQHEDSVALHEAALELHFSERCLGQARDVEMVLQERLAGLRTELDRSADILADNVVPGSDDRCQNTSHSVIGGSPRPGGAQISTIESLEAELMRLHAERPRLVAERAAQEGTRQSKRDLLERLRQEQAAAATLEQIDGLRGQIAEIDAQLTLLTDRQRNLNQTELSLLEVIERLKLRCQPRAVELASEYMRRLTDGGCAQVRCSAGGQPQLLFQMSQREEPITISQLSRGTRHQAALALRLALIRVRSENGLHVPLILDDVFITSDDLRASAVVQLLTEFAAAGQQIIFFTCQQDVCDLFLRFLVDVRMFGNGEPLPGSKPAPAVSVPEPVAIPALKAYVEEVRPVAPVVAEPIATDPMETDSLPSPLTASNWLFYLEVDHRVEDLAGINLGELDAFRAIGVHTIDDLLQQKVTTLEERARQRGYLISAERLEALRGQAELTCRVPMLRRSDAALLYAAGIRTAEVLADLRPETLHDRIVAFQRTEAGSRFRRAGRLIDRQQAINWARWGQHSRTMSDARTSRSLFSTPGAAAEQRSPESESITGRVARRQRVLTDGGSTRRRLPTEGESEAPQRRARRLARRRRIASRLRSSTITPTPNARTGKSDSESAERPVTTASLNGKQLRFYLSRVSDVESAPSIGPKTAESLQRMGVRTVEDLLSAGPDRLAEQFSQRRITSQVISQWQAQARLMCLVPELRGHDVQILVACGITDSDDLARRNPAELFAIVGPFAETKEGERIIRNGRKPDLAEVTDWINWAGSARSFRAA